MRSGGHADYQAQRGLPMKKELDDKISASLITTDEAELKELVGLVLTTLHDEAVYLPLSRTMDKALYKKDQLTGFEFSPVSYDLPFINLKRPK